MPVLIITPDMTAEIWLGAAGWAWGSHDMKGENTGLGTKTDKGQNKNHHFNPIGQNRPPPQTQSRRYGHRSAEGSQDKQGPHLGKNKIEVTGFAVFWDFIIVDHQKKR